MPSRRYTFSRTLRLSGARAFDRVFDAQVRTTAGPLAVYAAPNGLDRSRLGIAVPRRVGNAVVRNRVKRMVRESFRLLQHELPQGLDLVVVVRPHTPVGLADYQRLLSGAAKSLQRAWQRRPTIVQPDRQDAHG